MAEETAPLREYAPLLGFMEAKKLIPAYEQLATDRYAEPALQAAIAANALEQLYSLDEFWASYHALYSLKPDISKVVATDEFQAFEYRALVRHEKGAQLSPLAGMNAIRHAESGLYTAQFLETPPEIVRTGVSVVAREVRQAAPALSREDPDGAFGDGLRKLSRAFLVIVGAVVDVANAGFLVASFSALGMEALASLATGSGMIAAGARLPYQPGPSRNERQLIEH